MLRQFEDAVGECGASAVHRLDRAADRITVLFAVVFGDAAARLHRVCGDPVDVDLVAHNAIGTGERRVNRRLVADLVEKGFVARVVVPHRWRAGGERRRRGDHRGQNLVVDFDQLGCVFCLVDRVGDDKRDRVADIAHPFLGEQRLRTDKGRRPVAASARDARH